MIGRIFYFLGLIYRAKKKSKSKNKVLSIFFHNPSRKVFKKCMKWLINNNYYFLTANQLYDAFISKRLPCDKCVFVSFDDGWRDNFKNVIHLIEKYRIPVTFFISTEPIQSGVFWFSYFTQEQYLLQKTEFKNIKLDDLKNIHETIRRKIIDIIRANLKIQRDAMTIEELLYISKIPLVNIGSHSVNHALTIHCNQEELRFELSESKIQLKNWTGKEINCFAYPNGDYDGREYVLLKEFDYKMAFTIEQNYIDINNDYLFTIPRICIPDNTSFSENLSRMLKVWQKYLYKFDSYKK